MSEPVKQQSQDGRQTETSEAQGPMALELIDEVLARASHMTVTQSIQNLRAQGYSDQEITNLRHFGVDVPEAAMQDYDGVPDEFNQDKNIGEMTTMMSRVPGERLEELTTEPENTANPQPHTGHLQSMARPAPSDDPSPCISRYPPRTRPGLNIPDYEPPRINPLTLDVDREGPGFKDRNPNIIIFYVMGMPSSGKTTVSKQICERFGFNYISVSDLLEKERNNPDSKYQAALNYALPKGLLGPVKLVPEIIISGIKGDLDGDWSKLFMIDGFPIGPDRAVEFEKELQPCDKVLWFNCPKDMAVARTLQAPQSPLGLETYQERDERARKQMDDFVTKSTVTYSYFKRQGKLADIEAGYPLENVQQQIELILKNAMVDGFIGQRRETIEEMNRKAWNDMRSRMVDQHNKRLQSDADQELQSSQALSPELTQANEHTTKDQNTAHEPVTPSRPQSILEPAGDHQSRPDPLSREAKQKKMRDTWRAGAGNDDNGGESGI
ncbi:hypothetical protein ABW21_db0209082 [Orbilia brochopaga]|nr:hypothetical protein ABW21_db0209082 [Drechslerella brochopaga]